MSGSMLRAKAAIAGIGATEFSKNSGRTEISLAVEAALAALADAGIDPAEVDGVSTFVMDNNPEVDVHRLIGGQELKFFSRVDYGGGGACAPILHAAMAVATGVARTVLCYRAMNERSWYRFGQGASTAASALFKPSSLHAWNFPAGLTTPASQIAMFARRYAHEFGATSEDFGRVSVAARDFAATNPAAFFYQRPISLADHQASRWIAEPIRLLDCCQESDGAVAVIVTSAEQARDCRQAPVLVLGAAQAAGYDQQGGTSSYYRGDISGLPEMGLLARQLYAMAGLGPEDIQTAIIYDHFTPLVLPQLEEFGFCKRGEAKDFLQAGHHARGGRLPINTNGGQIGEAYIHGLNGLAEAVRQVRGTSVNQVPDVAHVLVTAGAAVPTSGLILGRS